MGPPDANAREAPTVRLAPANVNMHATTPTIASSALLDGDGGPGGAADAARSGRSSACRRRSPGRRRSHAARKWIPPRREIAASWAASRNTRVIESGLEFSDAGTHTLKGVPGEWRLDGVLDS